MMPVADPHTGSKKVSGSGRSHGVAAWGIERLRGCHGHSLAGCDRVLSVLGARQAPHGARMNRDTRERMLYRARTYTSTTSESTRAGAGATVCAGTCMWQCRRPAPVPWDVHGTYGEQHGRADNVTARATMMLRTWHTHTTHACPHTSHMHILCAIAF